MKNIMLISAMLISLNCHATELKSPDGNAIDPLAFEESPSALQNDKESRRMADEAVGDMVRINGGDISHIYRLGINTKSPQLAVVIHRSRVEEQNAKIIKLLERISSQLGH